MDWKYLLTSFEGRINRAKYWAGIGLLLAMAVAASLVDYAFGLSTGIELPGQEMGPVGILVALANTFFGIALYAKRWHDRNKSGWWTLILLLPVVGWFWMLIECGILPGTPGVNRFGRDPLA